MNKPLILISGATSDIMNELINKLVTSSIDVIGITRNIAKVNRHDIKWIECDLSEPEINLPFMQGVDLVVHAAALSNALNESEYDRVNFTSTKNLVENAKRYNVENFVYISSIFASNNCGMYGISKLKSEEYIKSNLTKWLIFRPSQIFGFSKNYPIDKLINYIANNKFILCPVGTKNNLYPLYYENLVDIIYHEITFPKQAQTTITINTTVAYNYYSLVRHIARVMNKRILIIPVFKFVMLLMRNLIIISGIKMKTYPDQIYRLYAEPDVSYPEGINSKFMTLTNYLKGKYR